MNTLLTDVCIDGKPTNENIMVFTNLDVKTLSAAYQNPKAKPRITWTDIFEVPDNELAYYLYEPSWLSPEEEERARQLALTNPNPQSNPQNHALQNHLG